RAALEEGAELAGILLLVAATSRNTRALRRSGGTPFELAGRRGPVLGAAAVLAPVLVGATFVLPFPGGPADWLAAAVLFGAALLVARRLMLSPAPAPAPASAWSPASSPATSPATASATAPLWVLFGWYLVASVGSNAVPLDWDPVLLGTRVGVRGLFLALLL